MASPSKYSPEVVDAICGAVSAGVPESHAAQAAGIHRDTLSEWKKKNPAFSDAIKKARSEAMAVRVRRVQQAAEGGKEIEVSETVKKGRDGSITKTTTTRKTSPAWQADAWYLERQFPDQFGQNRVDLKRLTRQIKRLCEKLGISEEDLDTPRAEASS